MAEFIIEHFQTPSGDPVQESASDPRRALEMAEKLGSGVTITGPDGRDFHVSDFRIALEAGEFDDA